MSSSQSITSFMPSPPFNDPSADTILRTSDGVAFRVYRAVLVCASPFFRQLFSLPHADTEAETPLLPIDESSHIFDRFLRMWYPGADTLVAFDGLEELDTFVELILGKYDMQFLTPLLQKHIHTYIETHCIGVFAIACYRGWRDVAQAAAKQALKTDLFAVLGDTKSKPQLKHLSAGHFQALLKYHHACGVAAASTGRMLPCSSAEYCWLKCNQCAAYTQQYEPIATGLPHRVHPRAWIFEYLDEASAMLTLKPRATFYALNSLVSAHIRAATCNGPCRAQGPRDIAAFITDKYLPAVNAAIDSVELDI
ncbi:hypothetical protein R3P38DRAFT_3257700 [Favolaschia claudopus]|uniref:BTB domain-containing protein n=1 Tax=Favolaschia claudopus TaxID=2862362 RepID=A0AAW0D599_9AGAR